MFGMTKQPYHTVQAEHLFDDLQRIRDTNPLIHSISNLVVMPIVANVLLALGASPIMAHAETELPDIINGCNAVVINIGTLDPTWLSAIQTTQAIALQKKRPIVFDPVGAGASQYRTDTAKAILAAGIQVLRGNASEIMALGGERCKPKGVDSLEASDQALPTAQALAKKYGCLVVVSGKIDLVVSTERYVWLSYGTPLLTKVVGMGCSLTAVIASFLTVNADSFNAAIHAMALFGLAGQLSSRTAAGPGTFYVQLLDTLSTLQVGDLGILLNQRHADYARQLL